MPLAVIKTSTCPASLGHRISLPTMTRVAKAIPNSTFFMISLALAFPGVEAKGSGCSSEKCGGGGLDKGSIAIIAVACVITGMCGLCIHLFSSC